MNIKRTTFSVLLTAMLMMPSTMMAQYGVGSEASEQNTPDDWQAVALPQLPAITSTNTFNITDYGASTSATDNSAAIQKALDAVPAEGGMVVIPKGTWMSGPVKIKKSKTILHFNDGATLKLLPFGSYPKSGSKYNNFIDASGQSDIVIEGDNKTTCVIDGQGADWWSAFEKNKKMERVNWLIYFSKGSRYIVKGITCRNAPKFNTGIFASDATVHDYIVRAPASEIKKGASHNTDGLAPKGSRINIYDCDISTGDDNVVLGTNSQFIHVWDCAFGTGHGASMGSYTSGLHDVLWEDCTFDGTTQGFRLKSQRGRSGDVYNLVMRNCTMKNVKSPIVIDAFYSGKPKHLSDATEEPVTAKTPKFHDILLQNVTSTGNSGKNAIYICGLPESYVDNVTFDNVKVSAKKGMVLAFCKNVKFINGCKITNTSNPSKYIEEEYKADYSGDFTGKEADGIVSITDDEAEKKSNDTLAGAWYNIKGQKTSKPSHGVYIHGGKKFVM